jgi:ceramide synthetase
MDSFYIFKMSYHCFELMNTIMFDMKRPDFPEYMLHHFLTFTLILFSYVVNYLPVGAAVMILHDVTDLTTTIFKLFCDVTPFNI